MKYLLQMAIAASFGFTLVGATTAQAAPVAMQSDLHQIGQTQRLHGRLLAQYGPQPRVEPLCSSPPINRGQVISVAGCTALARLREISDGSSVTTIRRYQLRRNRSVWDAIPWRDQRVLAQYDVFVLGNVAETEKATAPSK
jgi:hypothetical protein